MLAAEPSFSGSGSDSVLVQTWLCSRGRTCLLAGPCLLSLTSL